MCFCSNVLIMLQLCLTCEDVCEFMCRYVNVYVCTCVRVYVCTCVRVYVCICVRVSIYQQIGTPFDLPAWTVKDEI